MEPDNSRERWYRHIGYDQKRCYQRNMIWSWIAVYLPLFLFILWMNLPFLKHREAPRLKTKAVTVADLKQTARYGPPPGGLRKGFTVPMPSDFPRGYIGNNIKIVPDEAPPEAQKLASSSGDARDSLPDTSIFNPLPLRGIGLDGEGFGFADGKGEIVRTGMPPVQKYLELPDPPEREIKRTGQKGFASIKLAKPGWPPNSRLYDTAYVEIVLSIDEKGRIENWYVQKEIPPSRGFASELYEAIKRSEIKPFIIDDKKVGYTVKLAISWCRGCIPHIESLTGQVHVDFLPSADP